MTVFDKLQNLVNMYQIKSCKITTSKRKKCDIVEMKKQQPDILTQFSKQG